jgi:ADP-heptose:LPS heptosyltransferase/GT2 family glycosyltransferase
MKKIPIFLMFYNNIQWTKLSIKSIIKNTDKNIYNLILINNGSNSKIVEQLKLDYSECYFVDFESPVGIAYAYNKAINAYAEGSDLFVLIHNDVIVTNNWLRKMLNCYESMTQSVFDEVYAVLPRTNYTIEGSFTQFDDELKKEFIKHKFPNKKNISDDDIYKCIEDTYKEHGGLEKYSETIEKENNTMKIISQELSDFCVLINKKIYDQIGGFDNEFIDVGGYNKFFNYKATKFQSTAIMCLDTFVHHNGNTTSDGIGKNFITSFTKMNQICDIKIEQDMENDAKKLMINTKFMSGSFDILAIRDDGIGDIILSLYVLNGLKKINPKINITYCSRSNFLKFISGFDIVDRTIPIDEKILLNLKNDILNYGTMYSDKFDIVLNFIKLFEIFDKRETHRIDILSDYIINQISINEIKNSLNPIKPKYYILNGENKIEDYVVVAPFGTCSIRSLNKKIYESIIKKELKNNKVVLLSKDKINEIDIEIKNNKGFIDLSGKTKLEEIPFLLKNSKYCYSTDSGVFHIANLLNVPCKVFFGTINPLLRMTENKGGLKIIYKNDLNCVPCNDIGCPSVECMNYDENKLEEIVNDNNFRVD